MANQLALDAVEQELAGLQEKGTETQNTTSLLFGTRAAPPPIILRVGGVIGGVKDGCNDLALLTLVREERDSAFFFKFRYYLESWARTMIGLRDPIASLESNWFPATQPNAIRLMTGLSKAENIWKQRKQEYGVATNYEFHRNMLRRPDYAAYQSGLHSPEHLPPLEAAFFVLLRMEELARIALQDLVDTWEFCLLHSSPGSNGYFAYRKDSFWQSFTNLKEDEWKKLIDQEIDKELEGKTPAEYYADLLSQETEKDVNMRLSIPTSVKTEVWRRDQARCVGCGSQKFLEYDHIIPVSMGGSNTARNIQLLCEACNRKKGASLG